jgi:hypothetical protein
MKKNKELDNRNDKIIQMFRDLENAAVIASKFGLTRSYVSNLLKQKMHKKEIDGIKKARSEKLAKARELNYFNKYKKDDEFREHAIKRARERQKAIKDLAVDKIDFHMQAKNYFANVACLLFMVSDKTENALDKQLLSNIGNELLYLENNYSVKKKNLK